LPTKNYPDKLVHLDYNYTIHHKQNKMTKEQQAIKIIKQLIDQAIEAGVLKNIETANLVYQSFQILNDSVNGSSVDNASN
jgi:hypothetical protein